MKLSNPSRTLLMCLVCAGAALAVVAIGGEQARADTRRVFLNGVNLVDVDIANKKFDSCTVRFDAHGNVHITAHGFKVRKRETGTASKVHTAVDSKGRAVERADAPVTQRYFLVSKARTRHLVQYAVSVYLNGQFVQKVRATADPWVVELTDHIRPGKNHVKFVASKNYGRSKRRVSYSPTDTMEIVLGEGTVSKGIVSVRRPVVSYQRNASETRDFTDSYMFTSR